MRGPMPIKEETFSEIPPAWEDIGKGSYQKRPHTGDLGWTPYYSQLKNKCLSLKFVVLGIDAGPHTGWMQLYH